MTDIKESKELLQSLLKALDVIDKVVEDGKVVRHVPALIIALKPGLEGVGKVKDEVAGADDEALKELADLGIDLAIKLIEKFA